MKTSRIQPADLRQLRLILNLPQSKMATLLGISQPSLTNFERGQTPLPKKALAPLAAFLQGYPATPANGNRLIAARVRLNLTPAELSAQLVAPLAAYLSMEEGDTPIPWSVFLPLRTMEASAGFPPTFDPAADAAHHLDQSVIRPEEADVNLFARLIAAVEPPADVEARRMAEQAEKEDAAVEARNAAKLEQIWAERAARAERAKRDKETPAPPATPPPADEEDEDGDLDDSGLDDDDL